MKHLKGFVPSLLLLLLLALLVSMASPGVAHASTIRFHYWAHGDILRDSSSQFTNARCDTGWGLPLSGGSLAIDDCTIPVTNSTDFGGNATSGNVHYDGNGNLTSQVPYFYVALTIGSGTATVVTRNGVTKGQVATADEAQGVHIDVFCNAPPVSTTTTVNGVSTTVSTPQFCTVPDGDTDAGEVTTTPECSSQGVPDEAGGVCIPNGEVFTILRTNEIKTLALASCGAHKGGSVLASAQAVTAFPFNDLSVLSGGSLRALSPSGASNQVYTLNTANTPGVGMLAATLIVNEQRVHTDTNYAYISTSAIHITVSDPNGVTVLDVYLNDALAAIHCAHHLLPSDTLVA